MTPEEKEKAYQDFLKTVRPSWETQKAQIDELNGRLQILEAEFKNLKKQNETASAAIAVLQAVPKSVTK